MAIERKYRITFEGSDQQINKLASMEQQLAAVNQELKENRDALKKSGGENKEAAQKVALLTEQQKRLRGEQRKVSREVQTQDKALKSNSNTIEGMRQRVADLTRQWAKAEIGTKQFKQLEKQLDDTTRELLQYERAVGKSQRNVGNYQSALGGLKNSFVAVGSAITAGIMLFSSLGVSASNAIDTFAENERAQKSMEVALGRTSDALLRQADAMGYLTEGGETSILTQQAFLASLGFSEGKIQDVINAAIDLSAATGKDLDFAVRNLAKTYSGLTGELGELIPDLKEFTAEELRAGAATEYATDQFGGQARALTEVGVGQFNRFNETLSDLNNNIGRNMVNSLGQLANIAADIGNVIVELTQQTDRESDSVRALNARFNVEIETLKKLEPGSKNRARLISHINTTYKDYLPRLISESDTLEDIASAQKLANDQFKQKIILLAAEEELKDVAQKQLKNELRALELQLRLSKAEADIVDATASSWERASNSLHGVDTELEGANQRLKSTQQEIKSNAEQAAVLAREYDKVSQAASNLGLNVEQIITQTFAPPTGTTEGGEPAGALDQVQSEFIDPMEAPEVIQAREIGAILVGIENDTQQQIRDSIAQTLEFEKQAAIERTKANAQEAALKLGLAQTVFAGVQGLLKEGSKEAKALALITIAIDTAKGIAEATAAGAGVPFPGNLGAIASGVGVVLGNIAAAKKALQKERGGLLEKFNAGGVLMGKRHSQGGIQMFGRGGYFGEAEGGEAIINRRSTRLFKPVLSAINQAGGGRKFQLGGEVGQPQLPVNFGSILDTDNLIEGIVSGMNAKQVFLNVTDVNDAQREVHLNETEIAF